MASTRLQREFPALDGLNERISREHGPEATIVAIEPVQVGGIAGFFARRTFRVTIEVPEPAPPRPPAAGSAAGSGGAGGSAGGGAGPGTGRGGPAAGIEALLAAAEEAELREQLPTPSTQSEPFAQVLDNLIAYTRQPEPEQIASGRIAGTASSARDAARPASAARAGWVRPLSGPGDLVAVIGLGADTLSAAQRVAQRTGSLVVYGAARSPDAVDAEHRRDVLRRRAHAVVNGHGLTLAVVLDTTDVAGTVGAVAALEPDQVMVVVDASRKAEDTRHWVDAVRRLVPVDAMLVIGTAATASPETVDELGLPRGVADALD